MKLLSLKKFTKKQKIELLAQLGMLVNEHGIITKDGKPVIDKYIGKPVRLDNMILFGSQIVLDDNPLSIARYMDEYGEL